jgi:uncharacterized secreted protein with C-terminal beta-propeller domain
MEEIPQATKTPNINFFQSRKSFSLVMIALSIVIISLLYPKVKDVLTSGKIKDSLSGLLPSSPSFTKFASNDEFVSYLTSTSENTLYTGTTGVGGLVTVEDRVYAAPNAATKDSGQESTTTATSERASQTNVQVVGIDEADIVKTDGKNIYVSQENYLLKGERTVSSSGTTSSSGVSKDVPLPESYTQSQKIKIVSAFPYSDLKEKGAIDKAGDMFYYKNHLVVFSDNIIYGYDVTDPANPQSKWQFEYDTNNEIVSSRLVEGVVYVISKNIVSSGSVCPIPLSVGTTTLSINCTDIYHPSVEAPVDSLYTIIALDPLDGSVDQKISFLGSSGFSVTYVSNSSVYLTDTYYKDMIGYFYDFYVSEGKDLISAEALAKINKLKDLDISTQAKLTEFSIILDRYYSSLTADSLLTLQTELTNRMNAYAKTHMRDLERTKIAKVNLGKLDLVASGEVPGRPLNQFSLDEYQSHLRIATTSGDSLAGTSANDVYVLDDSLRISGSVLDLGQGERIYSVRFLGSNGYVVTYKETDPFYVLDLKDYASPKKVGELKIPGYSSYLHPLSDGIILGIGKEEQKVKLSLFDVSDPTKPTEISKYVLDEYWSDVLSTHHAFLQDSDHQVVFIPGGKGGYILSYKDKTLKLATAIESPGVKRSVYIGDFMYIVSENEISVLDESSWEKVAKLEI